MIAEYVLMGWGCVAAISAAVDAAAMFRILSGRDGAEALALTRRHAARSGGVRRWVAISLALDILMPWLIWQGLLTAESDQ